MARPSEIRLAVLGAPSLLCKRRPPVRLSPVAVLPPIHRTNLIHPTQQPPATRCISSPSTPSLHPVPTLPACPLRRRASLLQRPVNQVILNPLRSGCFRNVDGMVASATVHASCALRLVDIALRETSESTDVNPTLVESHILTVQPAWLKANLPTTTL